VETSILATLPVCINASAVGKAVLGLFWQPLGKVAATATTPNSQLL
jgi:hypothetical protein